MLKGLGNLGNIASMLKQAQEFQGKMSDLQEKLGQLRVEGGAGAGMVVVEATGQQKIVGCKIEESVFESHDKEMLEDLFIAATNQALDKAREAAAAEMQKLTGGLNIPGLGDALAKNLGIGPAGT